MNSIGIVYVATRELRYLCEAIASAESARRLLPELSITLFTDLPTPRRSSAQPFSRVIQIDSPAGEAAPQLAWGHGLHARIRCLEQSPYEKTVHLDTDTRVRSIEVLRAFELLDHCSIGLVPCSPHNSRSCRMYGPMFNGGMIAFRRDVNVEWLLRHWWALHAVHLVLAAMDPPGEVAYLSHLDDAQRRFMLTNDQTSLARLLSPVHNPHHIAVKVLGERWNARNIPRDQLDSVIIDHADFHKVDAANARQILEQRWPEVAAWLHRHATTPSRSLSDHGASMAQSREPRSLLEQLASELVRDQRVVSQADRDFLRRVLSESTGDASLDEAVAERVANAFAGSIAQRIGGVLAAEVVRQLGASRPITPGDPAVPGFGPMTPGFPLPGRNPLGPLGPLINPMAHVSPSNPGNDPADGPGVSPSNPGNDPAAHVSPSNPGNDPADGPGVSPSNPGNDPAARPEFGGREAAGRTPRTPSRVPGVGSRRK